MLQMHIACIVQKILTFNRTVKHIAKHIAKKIQKDIKSYKNLSHLAYLFYDSFISDLAKSFLTLRYLFLRVLEETQLFYNMVINTGLTL